MGRLIDADAFERTVMFGDAEDMQDVIYALRDYPTAYDPDKVVQQIKELSIRERGEIKTEDVITIVKDGGVNAD